ncbi:MAG: hypothetical protein Q8K92_06250 [Leadbetterella sp.]|nr:hypothetical protein [Leadbetterella sp.]
MSVEEITTAKNSTSTIKLIITLVSTIIGGGMFLGIAEMGYNGGLAFMGIGLIYLFGSIALGLLAPNIRDFLEKQKSTNLFELIDKIYPKGNNKISIKSLLAFCSFLVYFLMLAVQFVGIGIFYSYFTKTDLTSSSVLIAAIVSVVSTIIYSAFGGFKKDIITDIIQFVFILIGLTVVFYFGNFEKGFFSTIQNMTPTDYSLKGKYNFVYLIGAFLFVAPTFFVRYDIWQRIVTAKSNSSARISFIASGFVAFFAFCVFGFLGLYGKALGITNDQFVALELIEKSLTGFPFLLAIIAFFAAVMSSADTFLGVATLSLNNILNNSEVSESKQKNKFRYSAIVIGFVSVIITLISKDIIELFSVAFGILMPFLPTVFGAMFRKKPKTKEAYWSITLGLGFFFIALFFIPKEAFILGVLVSIITYAIVAKRNRE